MSLREALEDYVPRPDVVDLATWAAVRDQTIECATRMVDMPASSVLRRITVLAQFLAHSHENDLPMDANSLFTEDRIEAFVVTLNIPSRSTYRAYLRQVARVNAGNKVVWTAVPATYTRSTSRTIYTPEQVVRYLAVVDTQATARRRFILDSVLHLGLGFGLGSSEMKAVRTSDIFEEDGLLLCRTGDRVVPARTRYADGIARILRDCENERWFGDHLAGTKSFDPHLAKVEIPAYLPRLRVRVLRNTWLVDVMSDGSLTMPELLRVAGMSSAGSLDSVIPFLPVRQETYLRRASGVDD